MLKINKILSKKIKFPLSLRGALSHVIARERSDRSNLNLSGFSLIELMVAVAILAMAIFGIFNAYSIGFMGINDAKDRTIATNYVREILEEIKDLPFEKNEYISNSTDGTKFNETAFFEPNIEENANLKRVTAIISWKDRNNKDKSIQASTLIYDVQTPASEDAGVGSIVLIANPYYLYPGHVSTLTVIVKDQYGNTMTNYDSGNIVFSLSSSEYGSITSSTGVSDGIANATFESVENTEGELIVTATLTDNGEVYTDSLTLKITTTGVYINLTADPSILAADGNDTSTITAEVLDAVGNRIINVSTDITFIIRDNNIGTLSAPSTIATNPETGTCSITLTSTTTSGLARVIATALSLKSDFVDVVTTGESSEPTQISLSASSTDIYTNENSTITVKILDQFSLEIGYNGTITFDISPGIGTIPDIPFNGESSLSGNFTPTSSGTASITASSLLGELLSHSIDITVNNVPVEIILSSSSGSMYADRGVSYKEITANIVDASSSTVTSFNDDVLFSIDNSVFGEFSESETLKTVTAVNGVANILLYSTASAGSLTITASSGTLFEGTLGVTVYNIPNKVEVIANPDSINIGDSSTLAINIYHNKESIPFNGTVTLTQNSGDGENGIFQNDSLEFNGESSKTTVYNATQEGTVTITPSATFNDVSLTEIIDKIEIKEAVISLEFVAESVSYDSVEDNFFDFRILVSGGSINLEQMLIIWTGASGGEKIQQIIIEGSEVFSGEIQSGQTANTNYTLQTGESTIRFRFNKPIKNINNRVFTVTFISEEGSFELILFAGP